MLRSIAFAWLALTLATGPAAAADEPPDATASAVKSADPVVAAALSASLPAASFALAFPTGTLLWALTPGLTGAGHIYAGDWQRGVAVSAGGYGVAAGSYLLLAGLNGFSGLGPSEPATLPDGRRVSPGMNVAPLLYFAGAAAVTALYTGWASWDAYDTALRMRGPVPAPSAGAPAATPTTASPSSAPLARYGEAVSPAPTTPVVSYEQYRAIKRGMRYEEVAARFGRPGEERRWHRVDDRSEAVYRWTNPDGSFAEFTFENGAVTGMTNRDLR